MKVTTAVERQRLHVNKGWFERICITTQVSPLRLVHRHEQYRHDDPITPFLTAKVGHVLAHQTQQAPFVVELIASVQGGIGPVTETQRITMTRCGPQDAVEYESVVGMAPNPGLVASCGIIGVAKTGENMQDS